MKFISKTIILISFIFLLLGILFVFSKDNKYKIRQPVVIIYNNDRSSWDVIMDVKKNVFKNIEINWQNKKSHERK